MKKQFLTYIILLACLTAIAQPANIDISQTATFEGEPYLAVNPTNHQNMVVAWMADDLSTGFRMSIKSKTSFDGGTTWTNPFVQPHFGNNWFSADVSMQFSRNGTLYISYIDYRQAPDSGGVYVSHSLNGGISWSAPTQVWNEITEDPSKKPLDRPWLAVDNSGTSTDGAFFITTKPAPWILPPNRAYLKTSADSGQTWSTYRYVDTTNYLIGNMIAAPMAAPAVAKDGAFCIAYPSYLASQSVYAKILFAKTYNRGASFQYHDLLVNPVGLPPADSSYKQGYHLAANPANANQLAFVYLSGQNGDPDVYVSTTNNGGLTWSNGVRVNDDAVGNGIGQDMPWASYDSNNNLVIVWRDRRNGGAGFAQSTDTYCSVSQNNGVSFLPNLRLSNLSASYNTVLLQNGNDFMSCELINDTINVAWGDVRSGHLNIYFAKSSVNSGSGSGITAINPEDEELVSIYPNPFTSQTTITSTKYKVQSIKIMDVLGNSLQQLSVNNLQSTIDMTGYAKGIYFMQITDEKKNVMSRKIVIN